MTASRACYRDDDIRPFAACVSVEQAKPAAEWLVVGFELFTLDSPDFWRAFAFALALYRVQPCRATLYASVSCAYERLDRIFNWIYAISKFL